MGASGLHAARLVGWRGTAARLRAERGRQLPRERRLYGLGGTRRIRRDPSRRTGRAGMGGPRPQTSEGGQPADARAGGRRQPRSGVDAGASHRPEPASRGSCATRRCPASKPEASRRTSAKRRRTRTSVDSTRSAPPQRAASDREGLDGQDGLESRDGRAFLPFLPYPPHQPFPPYGLPATSTSVLKIISVPLRSESMLTFSSLPCIRVSSSAVMG